MGKLRHGAGRPDPPKLESRRSKSNTDYLGQKPKPCSPAGLRAQYQHSDQHSSDTAASPWPVHSQPVASPQPARGRPPRLTTGHQAPTGWRLVSTALPCGLTLSCKLSPVFHPTLEMREPKLKEWEDKAKATQLSRSVDEFRMEPWDLKAPSTAALVSK